MKNNYCEIVDNEEEVIHLRYMIKHKIHPELKKSGVAVRYFLEQDKIYSRDSASKMFSQAVSRNQLDEKILLKVLKQLVNEQINLIK